jgi:hypothetical protein
MGYMRRRPRELVAVGLYEIVQCLCVVELSLRFDAAVEKRLKTLAFRRCIFTVEFPSDEML